MSQFNSTSHKLANLQGFLSAFAILNTWNDLGHYYTVEVIEYDQTPETPHVCLKGFFETRFGHRLPSFTYVPFAKWQTEFRKAMRYWLLRSFTQDNRKLKDEFQPRRVREPRLRADFYQRVMTMILEITGNNVEMGEIRIGAEHFACEWQHFAFVGSKRAIILHFEASD